MLTDFHGRYIQQSVGNRFVHGVRWCGLFGNPDSEGKIHAVDTKPTSSLKHCVKEHIIKMMLIIIIIIIIMKFYSSHFALISKKQEIYDTLHITTYS